jgi:hypothetical protein
MRTKPDQRMLHVCYNTVALGGFHNHRLLKSRLLTRYTDEYGGGEGVALTHIHIPIRHGKPLLRRLCLLPAAGLSGPLALRASVAPGGDGSRGS